MGQFTPFDDFPEPPFVPPPPPDPLSLLDLREAGFATLADLEEFSTFLNNGINLGIEGVVERFAGYSELVDVLMAEAVADTVTAIAAQGQATVDKVSEAIDAELFALGAAISPIEGNVIEAVERTTKAVAGQIGGIEHQIQERVETPLGSIERAVDSVGTKVLRAIGGVADDVGSVVDPMIARVQTTLDGTVTDILERVSEPLTFLQENIPLQLSALGETVSAGLSAIPNLPGEIGEAIGGVFSKLAETLGLDQLLDLFNLFGQGVSAVRDRLGGTDDFTPRQASWNVPRSTEDFVNITLSAVPVIGQILQLDHPAEYERMRIDSFHHTRPSGLDSGTVLEHIRRFPESEADMRVNLERAGLSDDKVDAVLRIRHVPLPVLDNLDAWRRGEIAEDDLNPKLRANGLSPEDANLAKKLSLRLPPIQDQILFAVRGVFDIEESRRFGEFEGLPSALEAQFVDSFGIEGADFSKQVEVFAEQAGRLGLAPEWVAAYWTSHWRLPSLQTAFEMFHRLAPDIVEAEKADLTADGFNPSELAFDRQSLDRLVRSADFSSFWRPKLSAIAFNPLTRVDIRRMHKLGTLDNAAVLRAYRKVGFSPSDAQRMLDFTIAFNGEPDKSQTDEIRSLTKAQILDFVEHRLFTPEAGVESLKGIGYDDFAAEGFVELELTRRGRNEQKQAIALITEQALSGAISEIDAGIELDELGVSSDQKAVILTDLRIDLAKRSKQPSRAELDKFLEEGIINGEEYETALVALGFPAFWVSKFRKLLDPEGNL